MKLTGTVLWWDRKDGNGVIEDASGLEYYVDTSVIGDLNYLDKDDAVTFDKNPAMPHVRCAYRVELVDHECEETDCQECCPHCEWDHDQCMDCGKERCPGEAIDRAMDYIEGLND